MECPGSERLKDIKTKSETAIADIDFFTGFLYRLKGWTLPGPACPDRDPEYVLQEVFTI